MSHTPTELRAAAEAAQVEADACRARAGDLLREAARLDGDAARLRGEAWRAAWREMSHNERCAWVADWTIRQTLAVPGLAIGSSLSRFEEAAVWMGLSRMERDGVRERLREYERTLKPLRLPTP